MFKQKLNQIKVILGLEVKLESEKLIDGIVVETEVFEVGYPIFVLNEDGTKTPAPAGSHETESGKIIEVDQEGKIVEIKEKEEVEVEAAEEVEEEVKKEVKEEVMETPIPKELMEKLLDTLESFSTELETIKSKLADMESKFQQFSKSPGAEKFPTVHKADGEISLVEARIEQLNKMKAENVFGKKFKK